MKERRARKQGRLIWCPPRVRACVESRRQPSAASSAAQDKKRGADPEAEDEAKEEKKTKMADQKV